MSIILKALKKLQEEKDRRADGAASHAEEHKDEPIPADETAVLTPSSMTDEEHSDFDSAQVDMEDVHGKRQHFGAGPKALLIVVLILGVFTTGWFASRIYVGMRLAADSREAEPRGDEGGAAMSKGSGPSTTTVFAAGGCSHFACTGIAKLCDKLEPCAMMPRPSASKLLIGSSLAPGRL